MEATWSKNVVRTQTLIRGRRKFLRRILRAAKGYYMFRYAPLVAALIACSSVAPAHANFLEDFRDNVDHEYHRTVDKADRDYHNAADNVDREYHNAVGSLDRDYHNASDEFNRALDAGAKWFCTVMTLGGSDDGRAHCTVHAGAGVDSDGKHTQAYVFDPQSPDVHYPIPDRPEQTPSSSDLDAMQLVGKVPEMQDWERKEDERIQTYLTAGQSVGLPWVNASKEVRSPTKDGTIRPHAGFLDLRHDTRYPGNWRYHGGVDYLDKTGEEIYSIVTGTVTEVFQPSEPGLLALRIKTDKGYVAETLYVNPTPELKAAIDRHERVTVQAGDKIGTAQDLHAMVTDPSTGKLRPAYDPNKVPQHVHVTLKDSQGRFVSPDGKDVIVMKRGQVPVKLERSAEPVELAKPLKQ